VSNKTKIKLHQACLIDQIIEHERQKRITALGPKKKNIQMEMFIEFEKIETAKFR